MNNDLREFQSGAPDPDPDPVDLTIPEMLNLQAEVSEALSDTTKVVVIAIYTLPSNLVIGYRPDATSKPTTPPAPPPDGLNGVPPGNKSLVFRFPYVTKSHFTPTDVVPQLSKRFQRVSQIEAVVASSNQLYVDAVAAFVAENPITDDDCR